jgi:hypothetical protein
LATVNGNEAATSATLADAMIMEELVDDFELIHQPHRLRSTSAELL